MGRLSNEPIIQHFSHPHPLHLSSLDHLQQQILVPTLCTNCRLPARGGYGYACSPCSYVLHVQCSQMPPLIHHASHQAHPLSLLPVPAYPEGSFDCDACAKPGTGFSYHCHACGDVDLHTLCASLPLSLPNPALHPHPLALTFAPPYENKAFSCDVCGGMGSSQWLYRCASCEFDAHLECGGRQQQQQQPPPLPSPVGRSGSVVVQGSPRVVAMSRSGSGGILQGLGGVGMVRQMVQGLVSTTTQQIGSRFVPGYAGDGGAGANGGGGRGVPGGRGRGGGRGMVGYNGWNGNGGGRGGGGPPGAWNGYGGGRGQAGGPPGAWNGYGGGRGQGGGGPGAGNDPNGAQASYGDNGGNGDGSGGWNGYVDSSGGDVSGSGGWNGYVGGDGGGGNGGDGVDYGSVVDAVGGVDYGSVVDTVAGVGSAVLNAFGGESTS